MTPKTHGILGQIDRWVRHNYRSLRSFRKAQAEVGENNALADIFDSLNQCEISVLDLLAKVEAACGSGYPAGDANSLNNQEVAQLLSLNEQLKHLSIQLGAIADEINPRMKANVADPNDPMYDYELDAKITFHMREDDPEWRDVDDNILAERTEYLKKFYVVDIERDCNDRPIRRGIFAHSHCWLFHDLYDHDYSIYAPALSFRDCLRIGQIFIDVEILQQYSSINITEVSQSAPSSEFANSLNPHPRQPPRT